MSSLSNQPDRSPLTRASFTTWISAWHGILQLHEYDAQKHPDAKNDVFDRVDAVVTHCKVGREDVHEFYFQQGDTKLPTHVLVSDERTQSLVIGVRGTMSVADSLSDVQGLPFSLGGIGACLHALSSLNVAEVVGWY